VHFRVLFVSVRRAWFSVRTRTPTRYLLQNTHWHPTAPRPTVSLYRPTTPTTLQSPAFSSLPSPSVTAGLTQTFRDLKGHHHKRTPSQQSVHSVPHHFFTFQHHPQHAFLGHKHQRRVQHRHCQFRPHSHKILCNVPVRRFHQLNPGFPHSTLKALFPGTRLDQLQWAGVERSATNQQTKQQCEIP
jgi:hypothetical protein